MDGVQSASLSFPIVHKEYTPEGDLLIWGKATDGTVDSDKQIVDTNWSGKALQEWLQTGGNVRVQHSPHLYPAGKGVEVEVAKDGAHWVRSLIVEKTAKELVEKGILTAYSVGIAQPQIVRSMEAPGGKIVGGIIAELSLVDRPANKNCGFQLCKSATNGQPEFVGKMWGDMPTTFTPNDMRNLLTKREFSQDQRDSAASSGAAMPDGSFPIKNGSDLSNAISLAGNAKNPDAAKRHIKSRAAALGMSDKIPDTWKGVEAELGKGAKDCGNCGTGHDADSKARSCRNCGHKLPHADSSKSAGADLEERADADLEKGKMPPQFAAHAKKPGGGDGDAEDAKDGGADEASEGPDGDEDDNKPAFLQGKSAQPTDGVRAKDSKGLPRHREPDGGVVEDFEADAGLGEGGADESGGQGLPNDIWSESRSSNTPDTMKSDPWYTEFLAKIGPARQRPAKKSFGGRQVASYPINRLHDALCAAYTPDDVASEYPAMKGLTGALNDAWADLDAESRTIVKTLAEVASLDGSTTDGLILDDARVTLSKAFGEMYPNTRVTPGKITAGQFTRPYLSAGHPQLSIQSPGHMPGPGDASFGSTEAMRDASQFNRSNLTAGHASNSPGSSGNNGNSIPGSKPAGARLAAAAKAEAANAMQTLHDRLAEHHPYLCPMSPGTPSQLSAVSKAETEELRAQIEKMQTKHANELSELRGLIDQLGSQPDPNAAPHRGVVTKSASGGTGPVDRRSLVEEAKTHEQQERAAFYAQIAASGDVGLREAARALQAQTPTN